MIFTRRLLRQLGFESEIFCDNIPSEMKGDIKQQSLLAQQADYLLLVHHSLGYENDQWLKSLAAPKVLVYHNITPANLLPEGGPLRRLSVLGRQQLIDWAPGYIGAMGDSDSNSAELRAAHYKNVATISLLVDTDLVRSAPWDRAVIEPLRDAVNLLYVGRICENKHQLDLIDVLNELRHFADQPVRLILAGSVTSPEYLQQIQSRIQALSLQGQVVLAGKVPDTTLLALYRAADVFICLSEHEGFGMPLIESMLFDLPVVAFAASGIPDTLGEGGLLFDDPSPRAVAALLHMLLKEPGLRRRVLSGQRRNLKRFDATHLRLQFADYLRGLGVQIPVQAAPPPVGQVRPYWQIQGPFDSTYSLAIVNRELARALAGRQHDLGLRSMEGGGDFSPNPAFLTTNPDCAALVHRATQATQATQAPDVALRFCYPPHVDDMAANTRVVHSYGWEETGFPVEYVAAFNRKLDMVTVLSQSVKKVLEDNGVRIPIAVTGGGVDHLLRVQPQLPAQELRGFTFLHISSCFPRKGVDALLAAYGQAFRLEDDVTLVIKTFPNPHNTIDAQLAQLRKADAGYPHVVLVNQDCSDEELVGWYNVSDAFVAPSRGEGLGLPLAEAMLFNLPVITTGWGGQLDFCDDSTAWLCDYRFEKSRTHLGATHSAWADPVVEHLAQRLREVHSLSPAQRLARTSVAHQRILRDFTWDRVAQRTEQALAALAAQPTLRNEPKIGWLSTWHKRCGIAAYSSFLADAIPPDRLFVFADRSAERTAEDEQNVLRNWNTHTDETLDDVFADVIAHQVAVVVVQYNFGFFTLATLARFIQRLKQIGVSVHVFFHATADLVRGSETLSLSTIASELSQADRLYVHSIPDLNHLKALGLVNNVVFFPQGVLPTPRPDPAARSQITDAPSNATIIAAYGFLLPHKGLQQLIQAFSLLVSKDPSLHLLLVNALYPAPQSTLEHQACKALIKKLNLIKQVTLLTDYLPDVACAATLQAADLVIYPYQQTQESSSAAVRMGLASGRPVAVTPLAIFDDVADAVHRLPGTDPQALATGIRALLDDPTALKEQTAKTAQWVASRQWPLLSLRLLNTIDGLANPLSLQA
jgi:glycosyltransferase involved in cell wall biosynthesis